mgnify:FL=1
MSVSYTADPETKRQMQRRDRLRAKWGDPYKMEARPLTEAEQRFVAAYMHYESAAKSYQLAYNSNAKPSTMSREGGLVLKRPAVRRAILVWQDGATQKLRDDEMSRLQARSDRLTGTDISKERVLAEMKSLAFGNVADFLLFDEQGHPKFNLRNVSDAQMAAIEQLNIVVKNDAQGNPVVHVRIKLHNKHAALRLLGEHLGLWSGSGSSANLGLPDALPTPAPPKLHDTRQRIMDTLRRLAIPEALPEVTLPVAAVDHEDAEPVDLRPERPEEPDSRFPL